MGIHSTAIISDEAKIHKDVKIGPYCVIEGKVTIGEGTEIGSHTVISGETIIGKNNKIYPFASIGQNPQDLKYNNEKTKLIIGDENIIREYVTLNRGTTASGQTFIGNKNLFMAYAHVAHDCIVGDNCILANCATLAGHVELGNFSVIGGLAGAHQFVKIGEHVMIGGATKVTQDIIPYVTVNGNDCKVKGLNSIGLKRRGFTTDDIKQLKEAYNIVFNSNQTLKEAETKLKEKFDGNKVVMKITNFIEKCERGICR